MPTTEISDDQAWRKERFRHVYDELYDDLWRYVRRRSADDEAAADVLSEAMLVAWNRLDDLPPGDRTRPWMFGVARNLLRSGRRQRQRSVELAERLRRELATRPDSHDLRVTDLEVLVTALGDLKERDREVILLVAWDGLPHHEIAEILGCSENAVAVRLHRARQRLSSLMEKHS